jgi:acyl-CoA synthetase (NDP forming)
MDPADKRAAIARLFHPRNVVLVGASDRTDHWSRRVWDNLQRFGYAGSVFPVNPNRAEIWGTRCFPSLSALPDVPDHLAIFTAADVSLEVLRAGAAVGACSATLYAAGFGEGGDQEGARRAARLRKVLDEIGISIVGPNCMGVACGKSGFASIPDETLQPLAPSPIAVVAQSGALCAAINRAVNELGLKIAYFASCGGQIGCTVADFIDYFALESELRVILCYVEAIPDAERFFDAARRARANGKTVVAVKIGGSEAARAFALAHTASLAGNAQVFEAFASAAGIVSTRTLEDAVEAVEFLARAPLPRGRDIAVMTNSGALRNLITEAAARTGARLAALSPLTRETLGRALDQTDITNPLDTKRTIPTAQYVACLDALVDAPEIDIVLTAEELPLQEGAERRLANLLSLGGVAQRAAGVGKALAMFTPFVVSRTEHGSAVRARLPHVPVLRETEKTLRVIAALAETGCRQMQAGALFPPPTDTELTRSWRARASALTGPAPLNEVESKILLRLYGIPTPAERLVQTAEEAVEAALRIGFPVVLKAVTTAIPRKSDAGLVILGVTERAGVRAAAEMLTRRMQDLGVPLEGILVAKHMAGGIECVLGVVRDVEMGPAVMFGLGGVHVELFKDVRFAPASLDVEQARALVRATQASTLLDGFRGGAPADWNSLCNALVNLGRLACDLSDVIEAIDINPCLVREAAGGVFALDALVVLRPPTTRNEQRA